MEDNPVHSKIVLTAAHGRHSIFKTFINHVPFPLVIVGSDDENYTYSKDIKKGDYIITENKPLGRKWNTGLEHCKQYHFDYLIITGSDDIFSHNLWSWYDTITTHYAGFMDLYIYDGRVKYFPGYANNRQGEPQGSGRAIHRSVLEALNWTLWDDNINIGLDYSMTERLNKLSLTKQIIRLKDYDFVCVDVKTDDNLHSIEEYRGKWLDEKQAQWVMSLL